MGKINHDISANIVLGFVGMPYTIGLNMGLTERGILWAISQLEKQGESFTYEDIAAHIPCDKKTVAKYMPKLLESQKVRRIGAKKNKTIRYEVV